MTLPKLKRCAWAGSEPGMVTYHDVEWGVPTHDDRKLFELIVLEGAQAGLSWSTVLKKREGYREVTNGFDPERVARYTPAKLARLLQNPGIIRNRLKVASLVTNARAFLAVAERWGSFDRWLWTPLGGEPVQNRFASVGDIPTSTPLSDRLSKALKRAGFKFVGTTICYAFMQAAGLVNDHTTSCFRYEEVSM